MTPYYQDDRVTLWHGDYREYLSAVPPVDAIVTDPPYGDTSLDWDAWPQGWVADLSSSTNAQQLWSFGSFRMWLNHAHEFKTAGWRLGQDLIWEKQNGSSFHADRFKRVHEQIVHWYRGDWSDLDLDPQVTLDATARQVRRKTRPAHTGHIDDAPYRSEDGGPRLQRSVLYAPSCHGYADHPTQKPLEIVEPLIRYSTTPGQMVLDPFAGAGTTLIAARDAGRNAVGIEAREDYCEAAAKRLSHVTLFAL